MSDESPAPGPASGRGSVGSVLRKKLVSTPLARASTWMPGPRAMPTSAISLLAAKLWSPIRTSAASPGRAHGLAASFRKWDVWSVVTRGVRPRFASPQGRMDWKAWAWTMSAWWAPVSGPGHGA